MEQLQVSRRPDLGDPQRGRVLDDALARREARQGLFISPWLIGFVAFTLLPMVATLLFTFLNVTLAQDEPLQFVGVDNYTRCSATRRSGSRWPSRSVRLLWLPFIVIVLFLLALALNSVHTRGKGLFRRLLHALRRAVRGRRPGLAADVRRGGWINEFLQLLGWQNPPEWLFDIGWIYPALVIMAVWGIGAGVIINLAGLRGIPSSCMTRRRSTVRPASSSSAT